jgi:hypothetical protein
MKICSKCSLNKEDNSFSKNSSWCKECKRLLEKNRRLNNGIKEKKIPIVLNDSKECLICKKILPFSEFTIYNRNKRDGYNSYCKKCFSIKYKVDKEKSRVATKKYRENNKAYWNMLHRLNQFNRRNIIKVNNDGTVTKEFVDSVYSYEICSYCNKLCEEKEKTLDHIIPLIKGGKHSRDNICLACKSCNSSKKDKLLEEWNNDRS